MRTIGIDLGVSAKHNAVIADEQGQIIAPTIRLSTDPRDLERLLDRACQEGDGKVRVILEPTGLAWLPAASYFIQRGAAVYLVNAQQAADLRKFYRKHAKSDRISAKVLVRLPWVNPENLHPLHLNSADYLSGQRWCKQQDQLSKLMSAIKNRVRAWERAFWPGLEEIVDDLFAPWMRRWREVYYDPWQLEASEVGALAAFLIEAGAPAGQAERLAAGLKEVAQRVIELYGALDGQASPYVDYTALQDQVLRELRLLVVYEEEHRQIKKNVQQLYRKLYPNRDLETIKGIGEDGAAVYFFFIGEVERFACQKQFRGWHGIVPKSDQSGEVDKKGLPITKAGPDLVKKYAFINAEVARQWDPQIAAIYYEQMVNKGKHHVQAVCTCATHLLDRVRAVLRDGRPYELRDVDGTPVTWQQARRIIADRYQVPEHVRKRNSKATRKKRRDQQAERRQKKRRSRPDWQEADLLDHLIQG